MENHAFATLTPANTLARVAFSDTCDALISGHQNASEVPALHRVKIERPQQEYDGDVLRLKLEADRRSSQDADEASDMSLTEPNTDTEQYLRENGMVWAGCFLLAFELAPSMPELGWTVGKGLLGSRPQETNPGADLVLCTKPFAKKYKIDLRSLHARFNFASDNRAFFIAGFSRSQLAQLNVNGEPVQRQLFALNQHQMKIAFGSLGLALWLPRHEECSVPRTSLAVQVPGTNRDRQYSCTPLQPGH